MTPNLAARSNSISQRVMKTMDLDVYQAAKERLRHTFQEYDKVVVSYSGGKDSTVCLEVVLEVARELGKLPLDVLFCDEEVLLPETVEVVKRTSQRSEVNLLWVCAPVKYHNACSLEEPWWWPWDSTKRDVWVRQPPEDAIWLREGPHPIPLHAVKLLYPPEHGRIAFIVGLRGYESRPRMYGVLVSGGYIAKGPVPHIDKVRPIYDWRDKDVWLAIHRGGWDYNRAYDKLYRLRKNPKELRIATPFSTEALLHLRDWLIGWPATWERVRRRIPSVHAVALFHNRLHTPVRKQGETWQDAVWRYLEANPYDDHRHLELKLNTVLRHHRRHASFPLHETRSCPLCQFSWKKLARLAMFADPSRRLTIK